MKSQSMFGFLERRGPIQNEVSELDVGIILFSSIISLGVGMPIKVAEWFASNSRRIPV